MNLRKKIKKVTLTIYLTIMRIPKIIFWKWYYYKTIYGRYDKTAYSEEIGYLLKRGMAQKGRGLVFPYNFYESYKMDEEEVCFDESEKMLYVLQNNKKLYFPGNNKTWVARKICNLRIEQDLRSPHRYFTDFFTRPDQKEIFVDVGAAEGKEALEVVEMAKAEILIEYSDIWIDVLNKTFEPWKYKVKIIRAFASDKSENGKITLDSIMEETSDYFIKLDVEGAELEVLRGAERRLRIGGVRCVVCTYHKSEDQREIYNYLSDLGYTCSYSEGYCLNYAPEFKKWNKNPPFFRKGLIRAYKARINS